MFKKVDYSAVESQPDLKAKAEQLMPVLGGEVGERQGEVEVRWSPTAEGVLDLTLSRTLENGVSATHTGTFVASDFAEQDLPWRCRRVWDDLLGILLDKQHKRVMEYFDEPVEA